MDPTQKPANLKPIGPTVKAGVRRRLKYKHEESFGRGTSEEENIHYSLRYGDLIIDVKLYYGRIKISSRNPLTTAAITAIVSWLRSDYAGLALKDYLVRMFGEKWYLYMETPV